MRRRERRDGSIRWASEPIDKAQVLHLNCDAQDVDSSEVSDASSGSRAPGGGADHAANRARNTTPHLWVTGFDRVTFIPSRDGRIHIGGDAAYTVERKTRQHARLSGDPVAAERRRQAEEKLAGQVQQELRQAGSQAPVQPGPTGPQPDPVGRANAAQPSSSVLGMQWTSDGGGWQSVAAGAQDDPRRHQLMARLNALNGPPTGAGLSDGRPQLVLQGPGGSIAKQAPHPHSTVIVENNATGPTEPNVIATGSYLDPTGQPKPIYATPDTKVVSGLRVGRHVVPTDTVTFGPDGTMTTKSEGVSGGVQVTPDGSRSYDPNLSSGRTVEITGGQWGLDGEKLHEVGGDREVPLGGPEERTTINISGGQTSLAGDVTFGKTGDGSKTFTNNERGADAKAGDRSTSPPTGQSPGAPTSQSQGANFSNATFNITGGQNSNADGATFEQTNTPQGVHEKITVPAGQSPDVSTSFSSDGATFNEPTRVQGDGGQLTIEVPKGGIYTVDGCAEVKFEKGVTPDGVNARGSGKVDVAETTGRTQSIVDMKPGGEYKVHEAPSGAQFHVNSSSPDQVKLPEGARVTGGNGGYTIGNDQIQPPGAGGGTGRGADQGGMGLEKDQSLQQAKPPQAPPPQAPPQPPRE